MPLVSKSGHRPRVQHRFTRSFRGNRLAGLIANHPTPLQEHSNSAGKGLQNDTHSPWTEKRQYPMLRGMGKPANILKRFGQRVRDLRKAEGLSQEAFAADCSVDRTYMGGIERAERNLALRNIEKIADTLGISLSELMRGL